MMPRWASSHPAGPHEGNPVCGPMRQGGAQGPPPTDCNLGNAGHTRKSRQSLFIRDALPSGMYTCHPAPGAMRRSRSLLQPGGTLRGVAASKCNPPNHHTPSIGCHAVLHSIRQANSKPGTAPNRAIRKCQQSGRDEDSHREQAGMPHNPASIRPSTQSLFIRQRQQSVRIDQSGHNFNLQLTLPSAHTHQATQRG